MKYLPRLLAIICATVSFATVADTPEYPTQPVRLVVPFSPGGTADIPARLIAKQLNSTWPEAVIVENRPGAAGTIGESYVAKAAPDGYTLLMGTTSSHTTAPQLLAKPTYDPLNDLTPVTLVGWVRHILVVHPSVPAHSLGELLELARIKPGGLNYSSSGNGSSIHLATELFSRSAGIRMSQIPYGGVNPAVMAVVSGEVDVMLAPAAVALPHIHHGSLRAISALTPNRFATLPDVPTIAEEGLSAFRSSTWIGLMAPAGTSDSVINALQSAVAHAAEATEVREALDSLAIDLEISTPSEFEAIIKAETQEYGELIQQLGLK